MSPLDLTAIVAATRERIGEIDDELNQRVADLLAERGKLVASLAALTGEEIPDTAFPGTYAGPPVAPPVAPKPEPKAPPLKVTPHGEVEVAEREPEIDVPVTRKPEPKVTEPDVVRERADAVLKALAAGPLRWNDLMKKSDVYAANLREALDYLGDRVIKTEQGFKLAGQTPTPPPAEPVTKEPEPKETYVREDGAVRRKPTWPGIEAVPEYLRYLPAAQEGGPLKSRIKTAELQHRIMLALADHPNSLAGEIAEVIYGERDNSAHDNRVGSHFRKLREAGLIVQEKADRRKRWIPAGQPAKPGKPMRVALHALDQMNQTADRPVAEPEAREAKEAIDAQPPLPEPEVGVNPQAVARMQAWVREQPVGTAFNQHKAAEETKMSPALALRCLEALVAKEIVSDESPSADMRMFEYRKPTDPGAAAKLDAARRPVEAPSGSGGAPVPGTGGRVKAKNPEVDALIAKLVAEGADVAHAANGHFAVKITGKQRVLISATPGSSRSVLNDRTRLRRAGYPV